ncbi:MAG: NAD(P)/FAD-dependent oxidoreductase [Geminicoccaceae bacterium]
MSAAPRVVVVGAGIVGASIAYHLARRGAAVTVLDRGQPAGEATEKSFAWINATYGNPEPYFRLRFSSMQEYRRLEDELAGALGVAWQGCLIWDLADHELEDFSTRHAAWGYDVRLVERAEIMALEPALIAPPARAAYAAGDGTIEPVAATRALLAAATTWGATIRLDTEVADLATMAGGVRIVTGAGTLEADVCVLAAGVATAALCDRVGFSLPMRPSSGLLVHSTPGAPLLRHVIEAPGLHMKQERGRIVAGEDFGGGPAPNDREAEGQRLLGLVRQHVRGADDLAMERVTVGLRPMPEDGKPVVGFAPDVPGLYLATMHSGVTLAPAVGRFAAMEILDGARVALLAPYRPERFGIPS